VALRVLGVGTELDLDLDVGIISAEANRRIPPVGAAVEVGVVAAAIDGGPAPAHDIVLHADGLFPAGARVAVGGLAGLKADGEVVVVLEVAVLGHLEAGEHGFVTVGVDDLMLVGGPDAVGAAVVVKVVVAVLAAGGGAGVEVAESTREASVAIARVELTSGAVNANLVAAVGAVIAWVGGRVGGGVRSGEGGRVGSRPGGGESCRKPGGESCHREDLPRGGR